jgi:DNA-binding GntR family transcriptional regulator
VDLLLQLRRDLERFVIRLAAEKSSPTHRNQLLHVARVMRERREDMTVGEFNTLDRRIDKLILIAAAEPHQGQCGRAYDHRLPSRHP